MSHQSLLAKLEAGEYRIGFHGTAQKIKAFTSEGIGRGGDLNSGLGLFTSEIPENASEYAQNAFELGEGEHELVYVLAFSCRNPFTEIDRDDFYGRDEDGQQLADRDSFVCLRRNLLSEGYDAICFEGEGDVITVCLEPDKAIVLGELSVDQALELHESGMPLFDGVGILKALIHKHAGLLNFAPQRPPQTEPDGPGF